MKQTKRDEVATGWRERMAATKERLNLFNANPAAILDPYSQRDQGKESISGGGAIPTIGQDPSFNDELRRLNQ
jgi:hypothetical protein